ncbi:MAG: hypothetical protein GX350_01400 [Erysipelotrichaceae bacterium]|nr:hypothetical protein [Erysipelotrichaceae bacterium]
MGELKGQLLAVLAVVVAFGAIAAITKTLLSDTAEEIQQKMNEAESDLYGSQAEIQFLNYF